MKKLVPLILFAWMGLVHANWLSKTPLTQLSLTEAQIFSPAVTPKPFQLTDIDGKPFTVESFKGQWSMMFFGFTHCGYLCPTTMAELAKAMTALSQNHKSLPKVWFVSLDPARDNENTIKKYVQGFNPQFSGATGDAKTIATVTKQFGVMYEKLASTPSNKNDYQIEHSGVILLFNPKGELQALFPFPHNAANIAHDFTLITDNYS